MISFWTSSGSIPNNFLYSFKYVKIIAIDIGFPFLEKYSDITLTEVKEYYNKNLQLIFSSLSSSVNLTGIYFVPIDNY